MTVHCSSKQVRHERLTARRHLDFLLMMQRDRCFWCGRIIKTVASVRKNRRRGLCDLGRQFRYVDGEGQTITAYQATTDHLFPHALGGNSTAENLVASCVQCNRERNELQLKRMKDGKNGRDNHQKQANTVALAEAQAAPSTRIQP